MFPPSTSSLLRLIVVGIAFIVGTTCAFQTRDVTSRYRNNIWDPRSTTRANIVVSLSSDRESASMPWVYDTAPKSAREKAAFKNQVPFSDDLYEMIKNSIEILNKRLLISTNRHKDPSTLSIDEAAELRIKSLTTEEALWLTQAVEVIIADAQKFGPPEKPPKITDPL